MVHRNFAPTNFSKFQSFLRRPLSASPINKWQANIEQVAETPTGSCSDVVETTRISAADMQVKSKMIRPGYLPPHRAKKLNTFNIAETAATPNKHGVAI